MYPLKLPEYAVQTRENERQEIFCLLRRKYVALTPEEWVRQHFLNLLISHLSYPKALIRFEHSIKYFQSNKRSDISVMNPDGSVFLLVECKSFQNKLDVSVVKQLAEYNKVLDARFLAITNGLKHFIWEKVGEKFLQIQTFPHYRSFTNSKSY